jgi:tRNA 2-selenouridine synthase
LLARRPAQRRLQPHPARNRLGRPAPAGRLQELAPACHRTTGLLPPSFRFRVVSGATGSGKSRLLEAIAARGGQVLHLEELAAHKGSVLGNLPDTPQPAQKGFESQLLAALSALDPARPVFVEAESRKIGRLQVPDAAAGGHPRRPGLRIEAPLAARVEFLLHDYDYAVADPAWLVERLGHLRGLQSNETLARWQTLIAAGAFPALVEELLTQHYDPLYQRSQAHNYDSFDAATRYATDRLENTRYICLKICA